jgi:hypothetical protein
MKFMQPSNPRSEMSGNNQPTPSGVSSGVVPTGKGPAAPNVQQQQAEEPRRLSLAELFAEDDGDNSDGDNSASDDPSIPPDSMEGLSKRLGFKPEQIYNVKIPLADGAEPLTIGQLKDRVGELVDLETRETQFEQRRIQSEGELLRSQTEIRELLGMIPKEHIKPEVVNKIRLRHEDNMKRERIATLEHIPEWRDEKRRVEDLQGMIAFTKEWGFDEGFLATVSDHRAVKFIRDMYIRDKRIKKALANVTTPDSKGQRSSGKARKPAIRPNAQQSQRKSVAPDQRSRIAALFNQSE